MGKGQARKTSSVKAKKSPRVVGRWLWRLFVWFVLAVLAYQAYLFGSVVWYRWFNPQETAFMADEQARLSKLEPPKSIEHVWVPFNQISRYAKRAVIASEDTGFTEHSGIEWEAIEQAARANFASGQIRLGGSTITMQVAKNLFLSSDRSYIRKAQEIVIAFMIEVAWDKQRILEVYLNVAEWGVGVFGIEAAAKHYFGVPASRLNPRQAAWLAAILPAPKRYDRQRQSAWVERKTGIILRRMPQVQIP
ncbi:monofunctional biosynthetic peptidoglycan transglycosylase [Orrella daihaiensis]|uniref:Biosynthetic peptidoglycan transglycosylase n=1 Tax=Orrella daihaiensis TaxID=2782176 RepID=A0ABY4AMB8_9BURK|nr:monofunctional biosynthetic peptidoglycan transglycosylase [Orrella daihaiensis]